MSMQQTLSIVGAVLGGMTPLGPVGAALGSYAGNCSGCSLDLDEPESRPDENNMQQTAGEGAGQ